MDYVYAALLLHKQGHAITEPSLTKLIAATGKEVDESKVKVLVASLKDVDINKELESAMAAPTASAHHAAGGAEKKEEAPKEEKQEAAAEGLSALFG